MSQVFFLLNLRLEIVNIAVFGEPTAERWGQEFEWRISYPRSLVNSCSDIARVALPMTVGIYLSLHEPATFLRLNFEFEKLHGSKNRRDQLYEVTFADTLIRATKYK